MFQREISVEEELLQLQANAERGLRNTAVMDLAKAYEKVDRDKLLEVVEPWILRTVLQMMPATL